MGDNQHKADYERVSGQNSFTDFARGIEEHPQGGFYNNLVYGALRPMVEATPYGRAMHGRTDFDDYDLNKMVDLVEQTKPEDLESSGKALWDARDAISAAARELDGHIEKVHWVGESGDAFREWGRSLVKTTNALSDFAGGAGDQITAAAVGLASVRSAMPPRDTRPDRKRPDKFTEAEKTADKEEYADAVRVEKDRQEAINQMNRLSSYYAVAKEQLHGLNAQPPQFTAMPNVGVPKPAGVRRFATEEATSETLGESRAAPAGTTRHATVEQTGPARVHATTDTPPHSPDVIGGVERPDVPVGTNIDTVGTLPPPVTGPAAGHTAPATASPVAGGGLPSGFEGGFGPPVSRGVPGRTPSAAGGVRTPASAQGRAGTSGLGNSGSGRSAARGPLGQTGRATATGQSVAKGMASGSTSSSQMGRGVTGGTPSTSRTTTPRTTGAPTAGAGRGNGGGATGARGANGVVGGRPAPTTGTSAKGGPRIPRGTVIGAEGTANARPLTGRPGQRGVFGASDVTARSAPVANPARGAAAAPGTVTGTPSARNSATQAERNGMTRGGAGLVRGPGGQGKPGDTGGREGASRPDYLVEDEETHLPNPPRRDVPPVIN
ncbi:hypothetical protein ABZ920_27050 [Streptomyces sp. NPDC046831]|uniref:WXG100 family type VII secretion target n=1 Tax=Streptomyces sp. NPDC046831 TaxID=3154805 RepID=UPI0033E580B0